MKTIVKMTVETFITSKRNWTKGIVLENTDRVFAEAVKAMARY